MGLFDSLGSLLTGGSSISDPGTAGLQQGYTLAQPQLTAGTQNVADLISGQAVPYLQQQYRAAKPYLSNVYQTGQQGVDQLMTLLGLGPQGAAGAQAALAATPGYEFALQQATNAASGAIPRQAAATGYTGSGNLAKSIADYTSGLASQTYQNAVSNLSPFTGMFTGGASNLANLYTGLGGGVSNLFTGQAQQQSPFYQSQADLGWNLGAGTGAYGAQQGMVDLTAGGNLFGGLLNLGSKFLPGGGTTGSTAATAAPFNIFSDIRLKEEIEPVGKLFDGQNVYKFVYKGDSTPRIGLMADEVQARTPEAVSEVGGFKTVDYGRATERAAGIFDQFMMQAA
jgi:hypothetical protein